MRRAVIRVQYSDGREEHYPITPKANLNFEKKYRKPVHPRTFEGENGTRLNYALAWEAMAVWNARNDPGSIIPNLDAWIDTLEYMDSELEDVNPLAATTSDTSSASDSPSEPTP